jgi:hypothetical protein
MGQIVLGVSGKKQSGKGSLTNYLLRNAQELFAPDPDAIARDMMGNPFPHIDAKQYSMADPLKKVCIEMLGLSHEQCYGTNEEKNSLTQYKWENMPFYHKYLKDAEEKNHKHKADILRQLNEVNWQQKYAHLPASERLRWWDQPEVAELRRKSNETPFKAPVGYMTAREIIQTMGTEVLRQMHPDVHIQAFERIVLSEGFRVAICDDLRFPNEFHQIKAMGGIVIRLTRCVFPEDTHVSETSLDQDKFDWKLFDAVIDNKDLTVDETNVKAVEFLRNKGVLKNHG